MLVWGQKEKGSDLTREEFLRLSKPDAKALQEKPELPDYLEWVFFAFFALSTCRDLGMSRGPIPWTAVDRYAARNRLTIDEFERFEFLIRELDAAYLDHFAKVDEQQAKQKPNDRRNNRHRSRPPGGQRRGR